MRVAVPVAMKALFSSSRVVSFEPSMRRPRPPSQIAPSTSFLLSGTRNARAAREVPLEARIALSPAPSLTTGPDDDKEKFDWYSQWYAVMPVCDLDKRRPHAKKVLGLDLVVWWDRNEAAWKVFDDACPHRLAPLSEGRIDGAGRLQCVYHGWCFDGSGGCKFIPQAPADGAPVRTSKRACASAYPTTVQHDIVWFWPNRDPQHKDIVLKQKPPYIPALDDPVFSKQFVHRDIPYGYEVLIENLMDPAHIPYAHHGIFGIRPPHMREGGRPLDLRITRLDRDGFSAKHDRGISEFISPCVFYADFNILDPTIGSALSFRNQNGPATSATDARMGFLVFICVPVSPGQSRLIWTWPRNYDAWMNRAMPRWMVHLQANLVLDSDLFLLHAEERRIREAGSSEWHKACFVPTRSDALVVGFRRWLRNHAGSQVDWKGKYNGDLPPTPPREQLMDRYWSHVVNCHSCSEAYKGLKALGLALQVLAISSVGILAAMKPNVASAATRTAMVLAAVLLFGASKWIARFAYKSFRFHDYDHAFV